MNKGDIVKCIRSNGYNLTEGKEYIVEKFQKSVTLNGYTFPDYVYVKDDNNIIACCHASRFELI
jgi:hypothetical protein